ncbi:hypothetical protein JXL19_03040 [bacterium]|nr:hypothetical protein [bacterium]
MYKRIKKTILQDILKPIAETEGKIEEKADYIFGCLMQNGVVSDKDRHCFIREFFRHISKISDDISGILDKTLMKTLNKLHISIEEDAGEDHGTKNP